MDRPRIYVDFHEMVEADLVLLSKTDTKKDSSGAMVQLHEGLRVYVYMDDADEHGNPDNLIADGVVERNTSPYWTYVPWCCRIDEKGIRHESDERA